MSSPHIEWLQRRWALPAERCALVEKLIEATAQGDTALRLKPEDIPGEWGASLWSPDSACPEAIPPLVRVQEGDHSFLQTRRHFEAEQAIARNLRKRVSTASTKQPASSPAPSTDSWLAQLFPDAVSKPDDLQIKAVRTALSQRLALITGGPGTGKTYTLARLLALLLVQTGSTDPLRIRLAAPTGKAADRMKEAVREAIKTLPAGFSPYIEALERAADTSTTLHKLLGYNPVTGKCLHGLGRPLPCDVLIIDEASMIDVFMWKTLLEALPDRDRSRLIILGDPYQLESVGAGDVLYQLVMAPVLAPAHVRLEVSRRFAGKEHIQQLATAVVSNDAAKAGQLLRETQDKPATQGLSYLGEIHPRSLWQKLPEGVRAKIRELAYADSPEKALQLQNSVRILTAHRESGVGALGISAFIQAQLIHEEELLGGPPLNQPIIINVNDPETGLRNGSVGVIHAETTGVRKAWFPSPRKDAPLQSEAVAQLPDYSLAWALTIHRSQGSEYDDVLVVLPRDESPLATRMLIYTAITRARQRVYIAGPVETIIKAVSNPSRRCTLLGWHLKSPSAP